MNGSTVPRPRVLVVDDEQPIGDIIRRYCTQWEVLIETSPSAALTRLLSTEPFDLIFLDVVMPNLNGMEIYEKIRGREDLTSKVIFITGALHIDTVALFLIGTGCPVVEKPFGLEELEAVAKSVLKTE